MTTTSSKITTVILKTSQARLVLYVGILNATVGYLDYLISQYAPANLAGPTIIFVTAIANALAVYLSTEENTNVVQNAPAPASA